jgi:hypothetical protein
MFRAAVYEIFRLEVMDKVVNSDMEPKTKVAVPVFSISDAVQ